MPRAPKKCGALDCQVRVVGVTYCTTHEAAAQQRMDARRGNYRQRGYDSQHDREAVAAKAAAVAAGAICPRCGMPVLVGQRLDYGHSQARVYAPDSRADRVEHSHCNRSAQHRQD